MSLMNLAQNNGTLDSWPAMKKRIIPVNPPCLADNALCTPTQMCKAGYLFVKKSTGSYCCPKVMPAYGLAIDPCYKISVGHPYDIPPHPQTHDSDTYNRDRRRKRHRGKGALHQNKVVAADVSGGETPWMTYLLVGGAGYFGYKWYKKRKARKV